MSEKIDYAKRKTLAKLTAFTAGSLFVPSYLFPNNSKAFDLEYSNYSIPSNGSLEKLLSSMDYPHSFELCYEIPKNKEKNGDFVQGNFVLARVPEETRLSVELRHPRESKIVTVSEERDFSSGMVFYRESDFDLAKSEFKYNNEHFFFYDGTPNTVIGLIESLINGKVPKNSFIFRGNGSNLNEYSLFVKSSDKEGYDLVREAKIKGDSPRIPELKIFYKSVNGIQIPVEIHVEYKVKVGLGFLGSMYDSHTLKGVLSI